MRIEEDIKLDYSDVLIRPKRSTLRSRFDVNMERRYEFVNSKKVWTGIPIMASNMDTVGTFEMHRALSEHKVITCIAKHYNADPDNWWKLPYENSTNTLCVMGGIADWDMDQTINIWKNTRPAFIGLDVANGYTINGISEDNGILALSAGRDGVLLYQWNGDLNVDFIGQIETPYSNKVKVDGNNILISTEDGVFIYILN